MPRFYDFDVTLFDASPRIWRRFLLTTSATFEDLHRAIQKACGWNSSHLMRFYGDDERVDVAGWPDPEYDDVSVPDAKRVHLKPWFDEHDHVFYEYDFGDGWHHRVTLLGIVDSGVGGTRRLLDGARAFPPDDCGGISGYERCVRYVVDGIDDSPDEHLGDWLPRGWHPERFDLAAARRRFDTKSSTSAVGVVEKVTSPPSPTPPTTPTHNAWCEAFGIAVPDLAQVVARSTVAMKVGELAVIALLRNGAAMHEEEIVAALDAAGIVTGTGSTTSSLRKSIATGRLPLEFDHHGRLTLQRTSWKVSRIVRALRALEQPAVAALTKHEASGPLTRAEIDDAYDTRITAGESVTRFIAAVLDDERRPLDIDVLRTRFSGYGGADKRFESDVVLHRLTKTAGFVVVDRTVALLDDADVAAMRAFVRKRAKPVREARERQAEFAAAHERWQVTVAEQRRAAQLRRRVVLHATPSAQRPTRIEAFDATTGQRHAFDVVDPVGRAAFVGFIVGFEVVVGVRPRSILGAVDVDGDRFLQVLDLLPGKAKITIEGLIAGTLRVKSPPSLASLLGLYCYALLHGILWLTVRGGAEAVDLNAETTGDRNIYVALREAKGAVVSVLVLGERRVVRGEVLDRFDGEVVMQLQRGPPVRIELSRIGMLDVTGAVDLDWKLPVT